MRWTILLLITHDFFHPERMALRPAALLRRSVPIEGRFEAGNCGLHV
jgi:hypothetical protein